MSNYLDLDMDDGRNLQADQSNPKSSVVERHHLYEPARSVSKLNVSANPIYTQTTKGMISGTPVWQNKKIQSPFPSRLRSVQASKSPSPIPATTAVRRLENINGGNNSRLFFGKPSKINMQDIKVPSYSIKKDLILLSEDDDEEDPELANYLKTKFENRGSKESDNKTHVNPAPPKFSYGSFGDEDGNDGEDDDDILITGFNNTSSFASNSNEPTFSKNLVKREGEHREDDMERKRKAVLANKRALVEEHAIKEAQLQQQLAKQAKQRARLQEEERVNKLLERYSPITGLPQKYQIPYPFGVHFQVSSTPILPSVIHEYEIRQDMASDLPSALHVTQFRNLHLGLMYSVVHRINKFQELHATLDTFMRKVVEMQNIVQEKADKTAGHIKADVRYNQILRFFKTHKKNLSRKMGEVGEQIDRLKDYQKKISNRARKAEMKRQDLVLHRFSSKVVLEDPRVYELQPLENSLMVNTITEMYYFSTKQPLDTIRKMKLVVDSVPTIPIPELKPFPDIQSAPVTIDLDNYNTSDDNDDEVRVINETPISQNSLLRFSNVYEMDGYGYGSASGGSLGGTSNDSEGIKNLMESIKVAEFEEEGLAKTPEDLCISLLKHQRIGLSWMLQMEKSGNKGGILADDMGLGKTVQAISLMLASQSDDSRRKTNLIVGPVSLLHQWAQEINMKIQTNKSFKTFMFHSTNKLKKFSQLSEYDVVLVSYQTLGSEWRKHYGDELEENFKRKTMKPIRRAVSPFYSDDAVFHRIILDEAQYIKNRNTIASKAVASLSANFRWCLSGTPIQNKIDELYPLIRFLGIKPYNDWQKFNHQIITSIKHRNAGGTRKVHALLSAILLRRTKDSEIDGKPILTLPEKHIIEEKVEMDEKEKEFYQNLETQSAKKAGKLMNSTAKRAYSSILTLLLRMRQACDHEYLVRLGDEGDRAGKLERLTKGWEALHDYSISVLNRIEAEREGGFECLHCHEDLAETETLLLSKCAHPVCYDCHQEFFEENSESSWEGAVSAKCPMCGIQNLSSMSVDLQLFEAFNQGLDWQAVRRKFELDSKASDKNWRLQTIEKFKERDGKLIVSAKIKKTVELISKIMQESPGEKIIVFSQFMGYFDVIKMILRERNIEFLQYDGSMDMTSKNDTVTAFYKDSTKTVLLLSLKAGNVGLTLTCANHVIVSEPFWNPYVEKQAQDRVHRISQTKEVYVHRLLIDGTIEDRIMELQKQKEELVESALDPSARSKIGKLSRRELGFLFGLNGLAELEND